MLNKYQIMYLETSGNKNNFVLRRDNTLIDILIYKDVNYNCWFFNPTIRGP